MVKAFTASPPSSSSSGVSYGDSISFLERCFETSFPPAGVDPSLAVSSSSFGPVMKGKYGAFGAVTLEKSKLDLSQKQSKSSPEVSYFSFAFLHLDCAYALVLHGFF